MSRANRPELRSDWPSSGCRHPLEAWGQLHAREAVQNGVKCADQLETGEWRSDAMVDAPPDTTEW